MNRVEQHIENYLRNLPFYNLYDTSVEHENFTHIFKDKENKKIITIYRNRITAAEKFKSKSWLNPMHQKWERNIVKYDKFFIEKINRILQLHNIQRICFIWNTVCIDYNDSCKVHRPSTYNYKNNKWKKER